MNGQIALPLGYEVSYRRDNFSITPSNSDAFALAMGDWTSSRFMLNGAAACGKTHMLKIWFSEQQELGLKPVLLTADMVMARSVLDITAEANSFAFDNVDVFFEGLKPSESEERQQRIFTLMQEVEEHKGKIFFTSRHYAGRFPYPLHERVLSRLKSAATGEILVKNDDELLQAMLLKQFADRGIDLSPNLLAEIVSKVERTPEAVRELVEKADIESLQSHGGRLRRHTLQAIIQRQGDKPEK